MLCLEPGQSMLEDANDREERSKDENSISGVRSRRRCLQRLRGFRMRAAGDVDTLFLRSPARHQIRCTCRARCWQVREVPAVDQRSHAREDLVKVLVGHGTEYAVRGRIKA